MYSLPVISHRSGPVLPDDKKEDSDAFMKTHMNDQNFKGEIQTRFEQFILKLKEMNR